MGFSNVLSRTRWAAIGAAVAVSVGGGGLAITHAIVSSGERAVFVPIAPCRLFDYRPTPLQVGPRGTALQPGETFTQLVRGANGNCVIPADATAIAMNVTAVGGTAGSFLTVWPSDVSPRPVVSSLNWVAGAAPVANKVDVKLSAADGSVNLFNLAGTVSVLADVVGYYADHNFDDRYYTKTQADAQLAAKANSADVYTKAQINAMPSSTIIGAGAVNSNGTINSANYPQFGSAWTVTNPFTGAYLLTFPGLNPGCSSLVAPLVIVSGNEFSAGSQAPIGIVSVSCGSGDTHIQVDTWNAAGTAAARSFQFVAYRPGTGQILPTIAASDHPGATTCTINADGAVDCV